MKILRAGLITGFLGGTLDIVAACIIYPLVYPTFSAIRILQSVAVGVLGQESFDGGGRTAVLGLGLHFIIALCAGIVFVSVMSPFNVIRRYWPLTGFAWGVSMYIFMQKAVLPLSRVGAGNPDLKSMSIGLAIHVFVFGLPMAWVAYRLLRK